MMNADPQELVQVSRDVSKQLAKVVHELVSSAGWVQSEVSYQIFSLFLLPSLV